MKIQLKENNNYLPFEDFKYICDWLKTSDEDEIVIKWEGDINEDYLSKIINFIITESYLGVMKFFLEVDADKLKTEYLDIFERIFVNIPNFLDENGKIKLFDNLDSIYKERGKDVFSNPKTNAYIVVFSSLMEERGCDIETFWEVVRRYGSNDVRMQLKYPENVKNKEEYYKNLVPTYMRWIENVIDNSVFAVLDGMQIPVCYFTSEQLSLVAANSGNWHTMFGSMLKDLTVYPDMTLSCFLSKDTREINLRDISTYERLKEKILTMETQYTLQNYLPKCNDCILKRWNKCQGGCWIIQKGE